MRYKVGDTVKVNGCNTVFIVKNIFKTAQHETFAELCSGGSVDVRELTKV